jgi:cobalt-zinc-cadmium efflux system protein
MSHHDHTHSHQPDINQGNKNAFLVGIALNAAFVLAEIIAGFIYNSMALLTDAGHNISDIASLVLSLLAFRIARKRSTVAFTYGYKKTTILAALANAVLLLLAVGVLGFESITRLFSPERVEGGMIAWIAGLGIIINAVSAWLFFRVKNKDLNTRSAYLHLLADALVSVGVVVAGLLIQYTGWYWLDPAIGLVIMVVILVSTWGLLTESFRMTIDAVPPGIDLEDVKNVIRKIPGVDEVAHVHVWPLSTTENALTAHVRVDRSLSFEGKLELVKKIKHELQHHNIQHSTIELQ